MITYRTTGRWPPSPPLLENPTTRATRTHQKNAFRKRFTQKADPVGEIEGGGGADTDSLAQKSQVDGVKSRQLRRAAHRPCGPQYSSPAILSLRGASRRAAASLPCVRVAGRRALTMLPRSFACTTRSLSYSSCATRAVCARATHLSQHLQRGCDVLRH